MHGDLDAWQVLDATPQWVVVYDQQMRIRHANDAALRALGCPLSAIVGQTWEELGLPSRVMRPLLDEARKTRDDGLARQGELRMDGLGGVRWFSYWLQRIDSEGGPCVVSAKQEVTCLRRFANDMENYASIAAHDLRGPLISIGMRAEILERALAARPEAPALRHARSIRRSVRRLTGLVDDLLQYTRSGRIEPDLHAHDPRESVGTAVEALAPALEAEGAVVRVGELPLIHGDDGLLVRVWQNLLQNSLQYRGRDPPEIRIEAEGEQEAPCIVFTDNGPGIPAGREADALRPFSRLGGGDGTPHAGLGLALCSRIVDAHGGRLEILPHDTGARIALHFQAAARPQVVLRQRLGRRASHTEARAPLVGDMAGGSAA